jgi:hypothetical protein
MTQAYTRSVALQIQDSNVNVQGLKELEINFPNRLFLKALTVLTSVLFERALIRIFLAGMITKMLALHLKLS